MQVRYRYRLYPGPRQEQAWPGRSGARGWCSTTRCGSAARRASGGEKVSDTEVQRRVITLAKCTPERAWLGEVASVALVQACQDARRAYRNWFDSMSGKRKGRKVGHPRFRSASTGGSRSGSPATGLPCTGTACTWRRSGTSRSAGPGRCRPSRPSVTVIREADGRYYASFVVEVEAAPLPPVAARSASTSGWPALAVTSDGEVIANPGSCGGASGDLARAQRALSRKQKGSANREKARRRVAVLHRKVRETRLDHAHKTALRLVRDNQAVYAEDLAVSGLARTRLAKSVHDAGWSQLLRLLEEKAASLRARRSRRSAGSSPPARCARPAG